MLLRSWWIVVLTALSATIIALGLVYFTTPIYRASAQLVVSPNLEAYDDEDDAKIVSSLVALDKRSIVGTYAEVLNSGRIYKDTVAAMGISPDILGSYSHVTVVLPDANILELAVEGPDPELVTLLANSISQNAIDYVSELYSVYDINFLDTASQPSIPIRPQPVRDVGLAFVLGILLGALLAIIREQLRTPLEAFLERTQTDSMSGALNRRAFEDRVGDVTGRAADASLSMGLVRLDGLLGYLQVLPQPLAQQVLRKITQIMRKELRGNDVIGRWDDHTFAILLPETPGNAAVATFGRVQLALSKPLRYSPDGETMTLSPKVGICERLHGDGSTTIIERASSALTEAEREDSGLMLFKTRALVGY